MEKIDIQKLIFLAIFAAITILLLIIFSPFFSTLLWSLLFYILVNPLYKRCVRWVRPNARLASAYQNILAAIFALLVVALIILPIIFILREAFRQTFEVLQVLEGFIRRGAEALSFQPDDPLVVTLRGLTMNSVDLSTINIPNAILSFLRQSVNFIIRYSGYMVRNITNFLLTLAFIVFTLFFLLVDGRYLLSLFIKAIPLNKSLILIFVQRFKETTQHLITGYFIVALYQAVAAGVLFYLFDIPGFLLLSLLVLFFSFIPIFGAGGVWVPVVILKSIDASLAHTLLFAALCAFFISTVDNILRPFILKDRIKIHPLLIFFSILGALQHFGMQGILLGPIIVIFFFAALDIFLEQHNISHEEKL